MCEAYAGSKDPKFFTGQNCTGAIFPVHNPPFKGSDWYNLPSHFVAQSAYIPENYDFTGSEDLYRTGKIEFDKIGFMHFSRLHGSDQNDRIAKRNGAVKVHSNSLSPLGIALVTIGTVVALILVVIAIVFHSKNKGTRAHTA